ncbi:antitoxin component YwqK of YwqJK toxin-antitoxin module [Lewinella aquimaris]|uniref:Antitoxin component YwqK of YwqJK toxin-antitoxin module n=1 Tax=Neolewinella aquimaris TaxID=1835722 RepID=A0A840E7J7_9BACT|nr:toxin-antitoxin system YwqK family antitoxin [Neolewinella aquimaris]MBB4079913.1 antitoxin component YwqK of YwqJK toxin-antitoxin module [Neolewinella aquimaris]
MARTLLTLLLIGTLCTCGPAHEIEEETDALGFRSEYQVDPETGLRQGFGRRYDPAGNLIAEENYVDSKLDGTRTAYYPDGKPELVENYKMGQFEGEYVTYDSTGNLRMRGSYVDGAMAKVWTRYYPDGGVREVVTFADNRENGPFREWHENGNPSAAGAYLNGKEEGTLFVFDTTGVLEAVRECQQGACSTQWRREDGGTPPATAPNMTRPPAVNATN